MSQPEASDYHQLALPAGFQLEEYRVEDVLGKGGFGITYLAADVHLGTQVAIKELMPDGIATRVHNTTVAPQTRAHTENFEWAQQRFIEEARALAKLDHPNIVRVLRLFRAHGTAYMVMEYIRGQSLEAWLKGLPGPPSEKQLRDLLEDLLSGLEYVHEKGLLHRDIKPDNIFLRDDGRPVLLDFGSARADMGKTVMMTSVVTHGYSPFEQYQTQSHQGPFTDFYSLAAVLVRAVTGKKPPSAIDRFADEHTMVPMVEQARGRYSEAFLVAIDRALSIQAERRPKTVAEFRQLLAGAPASAAKEIPAQTAPSLAPPKQTTPPPPAPRQPEPAPFPAAATQGASGRMMAIHFVMGLALANVWILSFQSPAGAVSGRVPTLLDAFGAFVLPFCASWPLVAMTRRKLGANRLFLISLALASVVALLLAGCIWASHVAADASSGQPWERVFRCLLILEWLFLWSAWIARAGLQAGGPNGLPQGPWGNAALTLCGAAAGFVAAPLWLSLGISNVEGFFASGSTLAACLAGILLSLGTKDEAPPGQVTTLRLFQEEAGYPVFALSCIAVLVILMGHQAGDLASMASPETSTAMVAATLLVRAACFMIGMALIAGLLPRRNLKLCLTLLACTGVLIPFLPKWVGYPVDWREDSYQLGWATPLAEGLLQGAFFGCCALLAARSPAPLRMAAGMYWFIVCAVVGGLASVVMALFLDPRLPHFGCILRSPFGDGAAFWHAHDWSILAITQAALALLLVGAIQAGLPRSLFAKASPA